MAYAQWAGPVEIVQIQGDNITPSLLVWRRYHRRYPGVLENFLDINPGVLDGLAASPFLPVGAIVSIPIDQSILSGAPKSQTQITLWGS